MHGTKWTRSSSYGLSCDKAKAERLQRYSELRWSTDTSPALKRWGHLTQMSQERSASVADLPLDYLPLASPEATVLPLFSDEVLGSQMAGSRAASGSWLAYGRAVSEYSSACCHCRSGCHQECHWCPRL